MAGLPAPIVLPVDSRVTRAAFVNLPFTLYRGDPYWVAPLRIMERARWDPRCNASLRTRRVWRFVARRGRQTVGRVAAVVDPEFLARWEPGTGFFGFFECVDDRAVAAALLTSAERALREAGMRRVLGPINLSTQDEVGLLVEGFESRPMLLSPYNPPYYGRLLTEAAYRPAGDYHAFRWTPDSRAAPAVERLERRLASAGSDAVRLRASDPRRWNDDVCALHTLYNESFTDVWGFVPLSWDEFSERAAEFRRFYHPALAVFAEAGGRAVGFGLALPDINEALHALHGRLLPFGWLRLWRGVPRIRTARLILLGVRPEFRGRGIAALIAARVARAARQLGIRAAELSLVLESNREMRHVIAAFGGMPVKTYRLYAKTL